MLKIAKTKDGMYISAEQAEKGVDYYDVNGHIVRVSCKKETYFYHPHRKGVDNVLETEEHKQGKVLAKQLFQPFFPEIVEEKYFESVKRRADLFLSPKYVVEIQCSPIQLDVLTERHHNYQELGLTDWWLLGERYHQNKPFQKNRMFCKYHSYYGYHYWNVDVKRQCLWLHYHCTDDKRTSQVACYKNHKWTILPNYQIYWFTQHQWKKLWMYYFKQLNVGHRTLQALQTEWYMRRLVFRSYLPLLLLPVAVPTPSQRTQWLWKSQVLWHYLNDEPMPILKGFPFDTYYTKHFVQKYVEQLQKAGCFQQGKLIVPAKLAHPLAY